MMPAEQQEPIGGLEATRVKFVGMAADSLDQLPEIDDVMTFLVTAVCTGRGRERMKDGEMRVTARMDVQTLVAQGAPTRPSAAPATPPLFRVPTAADSDDWGDDGDEL